MVVVYKFIGRTAMDIAVAVLFILNLIACVIIINK